MQAPESEGSNIRNKILVLSDLSGQCDLTRPACSRCRRLGLGCEYLVPQHGKVFVNRSVTNPHVTAVDIFSNADKTKLPENSGPKQAPLAVPVRKRMLGAGRPELLGSGRRDPFANYPLQVSSVVHRTPCQPERGQKPFTEGSFEPHCYEHGIAASNVSDPSCSSAIYASRMLLPALHTHVLIDQRGFQVEV